MPIACLVGVVLGFWHDKLVIDYRKNIAVIRSVLTASGTRLGVWKNSCLNYFNRPKECLRSCWAKIPVDTMGRDVFRVLSWIFSLPLFFIAWLRKHPMNRANIITCLVSVAVSIGLWRVGYYSSLFSEGEPFKNMSLPSTFSIGMFMGSTLMFIFPLMSIAMGEDGGMEAFYRQYSKYSRYGVIGWSLFQLKNIVFMYMFAFVFTELMLAAICLLLVGVIATVAFICVVVIPARVFWRCVKVQGHWLCFGVTVSTTLIAWLSVRGLVSSATMAWTLALVNGMCAALATECLRLAYNWLVHKWDWLYELNHIKVWDEYGDPTCLFMFLWRTIASPPLARFKHAWCRWVWPHAPCVRINPEGFWSPV